ncbi:protein translocase subunit SecD [Rickettsiales bacterium]|nr:protein translocase subunit SecD [Rickettsiales bacterium]
MLNFSSWKIGFIIAVCLTAIFFCVPNFMPEHKTGEDSVFSQRRVNLGLDLRGGSYLLLEVDFKAYLNEQLENIGNEIRTTFRKEKVNGQRIGYVGGIRNSNGKILITLRDPSISEDVANIISDISDTLEVVEDGGSFEISFTEKSLEEMKRNLLDQSIEIVRRRVDETGTREPDIQRQGEDRILLQVPGLDNPEHLKRLLGKTAKLTFHLLDDSLPYPDTSRGPTPPGTVRLKSDSDSTQYAIKKRVIISGDLLVDARPGFSGNTGEPVINIRFNNLGARKFADITKQNIGKPFAIVLDNKVLTAPVIRDAILGGTAEISGSFTTKTANELAILLRAGSLPAPLDIVEERTVGPSLGADSIEAGKGAMVLAVAFVIIFMFVSYGLFGFFSDLALIMNIVLIMAVLSLFEATLTLPGIAGIVLTMGMAVDANVLIFERIREETRLGKTPFSAIDNGFRQAFKTIADSNITTLIAALLLYNFGSGPIKGFAVTLSVGIVTSMFSAILLTRLMVVLWLKNKRPKTLPI